jgi:hypothetical protein
VNIAIGQKVAQIIFKPYLSPRLELTNNLSDTTCQDGGFGSTDNTMIEVEHYVDTPTTRTTKVLQSSTEASMPHCITTEESITSSLPQMPCNIFLSADPFDDVIQISIRDFGSHQLLGFVLHQCPFRNLPQLKDVLPSQPASCIKNWRSTIQWAYITQIEEHIIRTIEDVNTAIKYCREQKLKEI